MPRSARHYDRDPQLVGPALGVLTSATRPLPGRTSVYSRRPSKLNLGGNVILVTSPNVTTHGLLLLTFSLERAMLPSAVTIRVLLA